VDTEYGRRASNDRLLQPQDDETLKQNKQLTHHSTAVIPLLYFSFLLTQLTISTYSPVPAGLASAAVDRTLNTWGRDLQTYLLLINPRELVEVEKRFGLKITGKGICRIEWLKRIQVA
jgi:hypothetical protein